MFVKSAFDVTSLLAIAGSTGVVIAGPQKNHHIR